MSYDQWADITIRSVNVCVVVRNAACAWGRFYCGAMDNAVAPDAINGVVVVPGDPFSLQTCGREAEAAGTQGSFDLYDGDTHVGTLRWDCPWGTPANTWAWYPSDSQHLTQISGGSATGAIGRLTVSVARLT